MQVQNVIHELITNGIEKRKVHKLYLINLSIIMLRKQYYSLSFSYPVD